MVAITNRCHGCGNPRQPADHFCRRCGAELPAAVARPVAAAFQSDGARVAWPYRIPVLNNRYTWSKWGWATFWSALISTAVVGAFLLLMFGGSFSYDLGVLWKLAIVMAVLCGVVILGLGLFGTMIAGNGVNARYLLDESTLTVRGGVVGDSQESLLLVFTDARNAAQTVEAAKALLPTSDAQVNWSSVRRLQVDAARHVITLRRRWHHPLRVYVPADHFAEVAAFVQALVSRAHTPPRPALPSAPRALGS